MSNATKIRQKEQKETTKEGGLSSTIPLLTPLIDPNWINSELAIALVKIFKIFLY